MHSQKYSLLQICDEKDNKIKKLEVTLMCLALSALTYPKPQLSGLENDKYFEYKVIFY